MNASASFLAAALLAVSAAHAEEPLLVNPSFEDPANSENPLDPQAAGWGTWGGWMNRETGWAPVRSGSCILAYHHFRIGDAESSGFYQDVPGVAEGADCTFRIFVCKDMNTVIDGVELRLEPFDGGAPVATFRAASGDIKANRWTELSVTGRAPLPGIRVVVAVHPRKSGTRDGAVKFDDASLEVKKGRS